MAKYVFVYHGGKMPETEAEAAEVMGKWQSWLAGMGDAVVDGGNPVGQSSTVNADGSVSDDGGANPLTGYTVVRASDKDGAIALAQGCPIVQDGSGSVEVAEIHEI